MPEDIVDLLEISPIVRGYVDGSLGTLKAVSTGLDEVFGEFVKDIPGSARRGSESKRLKAAIRHTREFLMPLAEEVLGTGGFFDRYPGSGRSKRPMNSPMDDRYSVMSAWRSTGPKSDHDHLYASDSGPWEQELVVIATEIRDQTGYYSGYRRTMSTQDSSRFGQAVAAIGALAAASEKSEVAGVIWSLTKACLADPSLSESVGTVVRRTMDDMVGHKKQKDH